MSSLALSTISANNSAGFSSADILSSNQTEHVLNMLKSIRAERSKALQAKIVRSRRIIYKTSPKADSKRRQENSSLSE